jgi:hypothetical protein
MSTLLPGINAGVPSGLILSGASLPFGAAERANPLALIPTLSVPQGWPLLKHRFSKNAL